MTKKEDEIIHHENQTNIFDIIEDTTSTSGSKCWGKINKNKGIYSLF